MNNAYAVTIENFYQKSCTVLFQSSVGDLRKTFNPCKFTWGAASDSTLMTINTASRTSGRVQARLIYQPRWDQSCAPKSCNVHFWDNPTFNSYGMMFGDWANDDISWSMELFPDQRYWDTYVGGVQVRNNITPFNVPASSSPNCMARCAQAPGSCDGYTVNSCRNYIIDSSRTFKLTTDNPLSSAGTKERPAYGGVYHVTFEIVNDNFYTQEAYYRSLIPTTPHYRQVDCPVFNNYTVATEEFAAGRQITLNSFRYPVNYFCEKMPVLILDTNKNLVDTSNTIPQDLLSGKTVTVPAGSIYRIDYVIRANKQLGLLCDKTNVSKNDDGTCPVGGTSVSATQCEVQPVLDGTNGGCTTKAGLIHFCSEGTWNDKVMGCLIQPTNTCPLGTVKRTSATGVTECIQYLPVIQMCTTGDLWNVDKERCCYGFQQEASCPKGLATYSNGQRLLTSGYLSIPLPTQGNITYDRNTDTCAYPRPLDPKCDTGQGEAIKLGVQ